MTNLILPRRRLLAPAVAAGLAAASPAIAKPAPILSPEIAERWEKGGVPAPSLMTDPALAMLMMAKAAGMLGGGGEAALRPQDVFAATLYTGNITARTITTGVDLATHGGLVWVKKRISSVHLIADTARGAGNILQTQSDSATASVPASITAFGTTGFSLGTDANSNDNTQLHVAWSFRRAAKFFDVVTFTAGSNANRRISHNLGVVPGMVVIKRIDAAQNWWTYHGSLTRNDYLKLNLTDASAAISNVWGSSDPTSTDFGVNETQITTAGGTYIAYLFAHDTDPSGIVQCGVVGTMGSTVTLGWRPQFLLVKRHNSTGSWWLNDSARTPFGQKLLEANTSSAEQDFGGVVFPTSSTGFTNNWENGPCVYLAIREPT